MPKSKKHLVETESFDKAQDKLRRSTEYQYLDLLQEILDDGEKKVDRGTDVVLYRFMSGQTNIKYLVDNNVHIWDDYPYKYYVRAVKKGMAKSLTKDEFIENIATNKAFAKEWGELPKIYGEMWRKWPTH